jgi:enamine deaminase RidA (YjgF/YER057c/UK114 family)
MPSLRVQEHVGNLDRVKNLVKVNIYMIATAQFTDHAVVADGASDLMAQLFGKENGHARMVSGMVSLPKGTSVVVETSAKTINPQGRENHHENTHHHHFNQRRRT